jgi:hypothetical protein
MTRLLSALGLLPVLGNTFLFAAVVHNVRDYGARGDGRVKDTASVQAAIDAAEKEGGGVVFVPAGSYLCGTVHLKNNIRIELAPGATILASPDRGDFDAYEKLTYQTGSDEETTYLYYSLLRGEDIHDVSIVGAGSVDGNRPKRGGPKPIALKNCRHVAIRGITVKNAGNYSISFLGCDDVDVDGVTILNAYADGIDPDCSRNVRIANCFIDSWDDGICLKTSLALGERRSTENVTVTNCVLTSSSNEIKLGTESSGDFNNIAFSNCALYPRRDPAKRDVAGLAIETVDGANITGLVVSNLVMRDIATPLFVRLGNRGRQMKTPTPGSLRNVSIQNLVATGALATCPIVGLPGHRIENVSLDDINMTFQGDEDKTPGIDVREAAADYPEANMFGTLPAYGFYIRHVDGLTLSHVRLGWQKPDLRPALMVDDVSNLELDGFATSTVSGAQPVLWLHGVRNALIRGSRLGIHAEEYLRLTGADTRGIKLIGNDLANAERPIERSPEVAPTAVFETADALPASSAKQ